MSASGRANTISELTRRDIFDFIRTNVNWAGRLSETEFLERLYPVSDLPSCDSRFENMAGDIWQHTVNNNDWDDDWVLTDPRLELESGPDEVLLAFLAEMLHPVVRPFSAEARRVLEAFNGYLEPDGWEIAERERVSGRPVFAARRLLPSAFQALDAAKSGDTGTAQEAPAEVATGTPPPALDDITEMKGRLDELAAGAAKTSEAPAGRGSRGEKELAGLVISSHGVADTSLANSHGETVSAKLLLALGVACFVGSITCLVPGIGHLGEERPRPGWTLLAGTWVLATIGFWLLSELYTKWKRAWVRIVFSLVAAGVILLAGAFAGEPRGVPAAPSGMPGDRQVADASTPSPDSAEDESAPGPTPAVPPQLTQVQRPAPPKDTGDAVVPNEQEQPPTQPRPEEPTAATRELIANFVHETSNYPDAPHAVKLTIQTNVTMQPTLLLVSCDSEIAQADYRLAGVSVMMGHFWRYTDDRRGYMIDLRETSFRPETPLVVTLSSKANITPVWVALCRVTDNGISLVSPKYPVALSRGEEGTP